jgi:hypothetical protein
MACPSDQSVGCGFLDVVDNDGSNDAERGQPRMADHRGTISKHATSVNRIPPFPRGLPWWM